MLGFFGGFFFEGWVFGVLFVCLGFFFFDFFFGWGLLGFFFFYFSGHGLFVKQLLAECASFHLQI